jgi:hypothetical protein
MLFFLLFLYLIHLRLSPIIPFPEGTDKYVLIILKLPFRLPAIFLLKSPLVSKNTNFRRGQTSLS